MTKFEKIKTMSIEELAHFLSCSAQMCNMNDEVMCGVCTNSGDDICNKESCIKWLNSKVEMQEGVNNDT